MAVSAILRTELPQNCAETCTTPGSQHFRSRTFPFANTGNRSQAAFTSSAHEHETVTSQSQTSRTVLNRKHMNRSQIVHGKFTDRVMYIYIYIYIYIHMVYHITLYDYYLIFSSYSPSARAPLPSEIVLLL